MDLTPLLALLVFSVSTPNDVPPPQIKISYEKYVLTENGLEVILSEDHSLPIVAVNIWYHTGAVNEELGRTGFAHLFEHLMFQGSKNVGDDQHLRLLDAAGASEVNGTTSFDRTNYFETVPSNQLALALWLESDRMGFLLDALTQKKFDNQRDVVMNERRQTVDNYPYGISDERLVQLLFPPDHPYYGNVIGSMVDIAAATIDDVRDFYTRYYAPANATLAIVGDIDIAKTKALVAKYFATLPQRQTPTIRKIETPILKNEERVIIKEPVQLPRVAYAWLSPAAYQDGDADCDIIAFILGNGHASRLYQKLVYELQLAQEVSVGQASNYLTSIFRIEVIGRPGVDIKRLEAEIQKVIDEIRSTPASAQEIERARNQLVTEMVAYLQKIGDLNGKADTLNRYNQYINKPDYFNEDLARYQRITPSSVLNVAKEVLNSTARAVVITVPK
ncbi:MAG: insulinase family protein [Deltaproteobacteria bacterium]|nr:insulinase family protein [Deltaproteobacteria bacterium]